MKMLQQDINAPVTSSMGRLFDGVSALLGLCDKTSYEGQAAMMLEFAIGNMQTEDYYDFTIEGNTKPLILDWKNILLSILDDLNSSVPLSTIAAKFHNTMAECIVAVSKLSEQEKIVLSGGCFQNKYLTERAVIKLRENGFAPYWHSSVPSNDGGIALGQIYALMRMKEGF